MSNPEKIKSLKKPCAHCPFLRNSKAGYLGGSYTAESFVDTHVKGEVLNPCHLTVDSRREGWQEVFAQGKNGRACEGQARFFANTCKMPRPDSLITPSETDKAVFNWTHEFIEHHKDAELDTP